MKIKRILQFLAIGAAILAGLVYVIVRSSLDVALRDTARHQACLYDRAVELFIGDRHTEPQELTELAPFAVITKDPWGVPYFMTRDASGNLKIASAGPDGSPSTTDDITCQKRETR